MRDDDEFTPKLGRIGGKPGAGERSYRNRVLKGIAREGGRRIGKAARFSGSRVGRGSGIARVLRSRDRTAAFRNRRVIVKARIAKLAGKGLANARAHLRYIQRDGVTRDGEKGALYDREADKADGRAFIDRAEGDRHQFRFIVSPEEGAQYEDLKPLVRRLMERMEQDLGTKLDWVAVDHYNTGHPHSHMVVRGKDDKGHDLIIAREYITHGMRERAAEIVALDLGPRTESEIEGTLRNEVEQERFTSLDRDLMKHADADGLVAATGNDAFRQSLRAGRLKKLERLGLAAEIAPGRWQLSPQLKPILQQMGEREDIIRTMQRDLARAARAHAPADYAIYDPEDPNAAKIVGRIAAHGFSDEWHERRYVIVEATDGRTHYVDIGVTDPAGLPGDGGIVSATPTRAGAKASDRTIAEIAAGHDGTYDVAFHAEHDPRASPEFILSHIRRLEALRRAGVDVERRKDGSWTIPPDHLEQAARHEQAQARFRPVQIEMLSPVNLDRQIAVEGATWLDRELLRGAADEIRDAGFGHEMREAMDRRRQWLIAQGFAREETGRTVYPTGMESDLQCRELANEGTKIARAKGLAYSETKQGDHVSGIYRQRIDLASGRFALIEKSREFTLVPWRPVIEDSMGREVSGIMRGDSISWALGRQRSGPSIS